MEHSENIKKRYVNHSDMKLEKFKKAAYEVIEYKEKIIRMLCAILEVQGITTVNIKEYISSSNEPSLDSFLDNNQYDRRTCCICHNELSENDKNEIINKVKLEKKENEKKSKLLFKVMKLQAENKDYPRKDICS
ncbi:hypothetical protein PFUGPA_02356 [Plasmodium falciparum Palo Alto/Uganda]|uniref:Uncharacterized protein n=1 Tax=Plasmodium falciparum (isolate Palo Alto / Uganda) TaxID=57270 RepID=W4J1S4_PLAFP|nr:hypothetical protein PFUGPA_02356 [Plasmodium falciparum Palo Alto/Uganda]